MSSLLQLQQRTSLWKSSAHIRRRYSSEALESGFPKPDPKYDETIMAIPRSKSGTNISTKEHKVGRVLAILFEQEDGQHGSNKRLISVQTTQIRKLVNHLGRSFFLSRTQTQ